MQKLEPTSVDVKIANNSNRYNITQQESSHLLGTAEGGTFGTRWQISNEKLYIIAPVSTSQAVVTSVWSFNFERLTTAEKSYTKFKYIQ